MKKQKTQDYLRKCLRYTSFVKKNTHFFFFLIANPDQVEILSVPGLIPNARQTKKIWNVTIISAGGKEIFLTDFWLSPKITENPEMYPNNLTYCLKHIQVWYL